MEKMSLMEGYPEVLRNSPCLYILHPLRSHAFSYHEHYITSANNNPPEDRQHYRSFPTTVSQLKICDFPGETFKGFEVP
jgi:hypothetical protein